MVEVLDHSPPNLTAVDRLLLMAIAEHASDETREGWPGWELIARRMQWEGHKDGGKHAVNTALGNLARRGVKIRVSRGTDKNGKPIYAAHGHRTTYRIPVLRRVATVATHEGGQSLPPIGAEGWQSQGGKGGNSKAGRVAATATPSPQEPSGNPHSVRRSRVGQLIVAAGAADDEEIQATIDKIKTEHTPNNLGGYINRLADNGDLPAIVEQVRTDRHRATIAAWIASLSTMPECPDGQPGGDVPRPDTGQPQCAMCRVRARREAA